MSEETEDNLIINREDEMMLLCLIASLTESSYQEELDWETLLHSLDVVHSLGADVCLIWGHSLYISMGDYFDRIALTNLNLNIFQALHHFSHWYIKQNKDETTQA